VFEFEFVFVVKSNIFTENKRSLIMNFIDLFCGIGGFRIAFEAQNATCVFSSDVDKFAGQTYQHNFGDFPSGDITEIKANEIPDFDILTAGFPCQPFSYAGRNEGFKDKVRGTLFFDVLRILEYHRPKMFLLENVKGLKSHEQGETMETIIQSLEDLGYSVHWTILNSYHFGIPQYRERWYCVGFDKDIQFQFPKGKSTGATLRDIINEDYNDVEKLKISDFELSRIKFHFENQHKEKRVQHDSSMYAPQTKKGKHGVYSYQKADGSLRFHVGDRAKTQIQEAFYACLDTYAPTIIKNRVPKLWDIQRKLSVEEAKLLQGYPEWFEFPVSDAQAYMQLGNSVTVPVVQAIAKAMVEVYEIGKMIGIEEKKLKAA
jgi:DNA (cytosine-5)-methyltransferase 1